MSALQLLWVALGGAVGSVGRVLITVALPAERFAWGTLLVNITGSFLIGWLMGRLGGPAGENARLHALLVAGFCGGFTTFSAFSWRVFDHFQKGQPVAALGNVLLSVTLCLLATWVGWRLTR